ncbi:CocE/NonD family hydrolase [bacterium]|nr:CocE/NonD family hydrolase [bacterium]
MKARIGFTSLLIVSLLFVSFIPVPFAAELSQPTYKVIEELDVKVTMRDGIRLSTNIYRPDAEGKFPVLLTRTPYGNGGAGNGGGHYWAERGYVTIIQDTRGRFESEGLFYPVVFEADDGLDTQRWVSEQPWCNGKIGTFGGSYVGMTQWMPALKGSQYVTAMFTTVPYTENYTVAFQNGALRQRLFTEWYTMMTAPYNIDSKDFMNTASDRVDRFLPRIDQDTQTGWRLPYTRDVLGHPEDDSYWEPIRFEGHYRNIRSAIYIVAGWYDLFTGQNLKNYREMTAPAIPGDIRSKQRIIVGPWGHGTWSGSKIGDLDFGSDAVPDMNGLMLRWFDYHLKGINTGIMDDPPVRIFVMGDNIWRFEKEWPLARTKFTRYYFHGNGSANTKDGDGVLALKVPGNEPPDRFLYDPDDPVPSAPDSGTFSDFRYYPTDHGALEERNDILVYTTPPLQKDTEVTGPVEVILNAASSAVNTDFTGKLLDVYPDGKAIYLCDGIIRASFRDGPTNTSAIEPGRVYEYHLDLWATSNVFKKGHRIRVEISSSNFPRFDRNLNTGKNFATETEWVKAEQTVYHDAHNPSCIVLPIIPR